MKVLGDPGKGLLPAGIGGSGTATEAQMAAMEAILREGLAQGAVAMGFGSAYTPGAPIAEIERMFRVAARRRRIGAHPHARRRRRPAARPSPRRRRPARRCTSSTSTRRRATRSTSSSRAIQAARDAGQDVTTEAYPYGAGMTEIQSALFDDWQTWPDERFALHQLVSTGERLTRATFAKARKAGGTVIIHGRSEAQTRAAIVSPLSMIASDGFIENGRGHPRTSGTYAKVLGRYVREERALPLMDALRRMTLSRRAGSSGGRRRWREGPRQGGRRRRPHDLRSGDRDRSRDAYEDATIPSAGIPFVVIGGQVVVDNGRVTTARPGSAIRAPISVAEERLANGEQRTANSE